MAFYDGNIEKREASAAISNLLEQAQEILRKAQAIADKSMVWFSFDPLDIYGAGISYDPGWAEERKNTFEERKEEYPEEYADMTYQEFLEDYVDDFENPSGWYSSSQGC